MYRSDHRNELFRFKTNMYRLREERSIEPKTLAHLVSSTLYEKRFFNFTLELIIDSVRISLVPLLPVSILRQMYRIYVDSIILGVSTCHRRSLSLERPRNNYTECWRLYTNQILNLNSFSRRWVRLFLMLLIEMLFLDGELWVMSCITLSLRDWLLVLRMRSSRGIWKGEWIN